MERFNMDFHGFDYQLHSDLEDELMGCELPCPAKRRVPAAADVLAQQDAAAPIPEHSDDDFNEPDDFDEPDDPDHAGYPDEDEGSCEDACENACDDACDDACEDACEDACDMACEDDCVNNCQVFHDEDLEGEKDHTRGYVENPENLKYSDDLFHDEDPEDSGSLSDGEEQ